MKNIFVIADVNLKEQKCYNSTKHEFEGEYERMNNITAITEKRVMTADCKYSDLLKYLLNKMKSQIGWYSASISEMKKYNVQLDNAKQMNVYKSNEMYGLCYTYNDYIRYVGTNDLSYVNIDDFNGLVKSVITGNGKHNPHKG